MSRIILVTGGSRSGKSRYAMERALTYTRRTFVATAVAFDDGMRDRIARHKKERAEQFTTIEEPLDLAGTVASITNADVILIDCLTVWLGNLMYHGELNGSESPRIDAFETALREAKSDIIIVTNEVGMGIVPENEMAREYRDAAGFLNQRIAASADEVIFTVSGIPMTIKNTA